MLLNLVSFEQRLNFNRPASVATRVVASREHESGEVRCATLPVASAILRSSNELRR